MPSGHLLEPYLYDVRTEGSYGTRVSPPTGFGSLALDAAYRYQGNSPVKGHHTTGHNVSVSLNSGTGGAFGLAPAIGYNWKSNIGFRGGTRPFPAGCNAAPSVHLVAKRF